jgi:hypothetical protein
VPVVHRRPIAGEHVFRKRVHLRLLCPGHFVEFIQKSTVSNPSLTNITMAKTQNSKKETKKQPLKTPAEKKAAKREKKSR